MYVLKSGFFNKFYLYCINNDEVNMQHTAMELPNFPLFPPDVSLDYVFFQFP